MRATEQAPNASVALYGRRQPSHRRSATRAARPNPHADSATGTKSSNESPYATTPPCGGAS